LNQSNASAKIPTLSVKEFPTFWAGGLLPPTKGLGLTVKIPEYIKIPIRLALSAWWQWL